MIVIVDDEINEFENLQLNNIVTPIDVNRLRQLLIQSGYDTTKLQELTDSFNSGFDIGYRGPLNRQSQAANIPI